MAYPEHQCHHGRVNSTKSNDVPLPSLFALFTVYPRRTEDNDQFNCDCNFSPAGCSPSALVAMARVPHEDGGTKIFHARSRAAPRRATESKEDIANLKHVHIGGNQEAASHAR